MLNVSLIYLCCVTILYWWDFFLEIAHRYTWVNFTTLENFRCSQIEIKPVLNQLSNIYARASIMRHYFWLMGKYF